MRNAKYDYTELCRKYMRKTQTDTIEAILENEDVEGDIEQWQDNKLFRRVWKRENEKHAEEMPLQDKIKYEREAAMESKSVRELKKRNEFLLKMLDETEQRLEEVLAMERPQTPIIIEPRKRHSISEATIFAAASDWHVEERVDADIVNNLNHYDLSESSKRMKKFFQNLLVLTKKERQHSDIKDLVLWLGGDFMTGYIHEELLESNYLSPTETILFLKQHLIAGIEFLLKEGGFDNIHIPTNAGNHGRVGLKMKVATGYKNSYEWLLYRVLQDYFEPNKKVNFNICKGDFNFTKIYDKVIRTTHGFDLKYNGGIGGITVPALKFIKNQNEIMHADYDVWGHFHNYLPHSHFCQNGSLIGVSSYGRKFGGQEPKQAFFLIDKDRGITIHTPIFVR